MALLISSVFLISAFVLLRSADIAYGYIQAKAYIRGVLYAVLAVLALIAVVVSLFKV